MSQQEDDLRALAKIMDFLRAVSIILVVAHLYWYETSAKPSFIEKFHLFVFRSILQRIYWYN